MTTALTLVNAVLRRLRESQVNGFSAAYPALILDFVNETTREVEDAWRWTMLRQTISVTTSPGVQIYTIPGTGQHWQFQDKYNRIFNFTSRNYVFPFPASAIEEYKWTTNTTNAIPVYYAVNGQSGTDATFELYPTPDQAYVLQIPLYIPDADLVNPTDIVTVPPLPIILGAWARAISERGEDQGFKTTDQYTLYQNVLGYQIALDAARVPDELRWNQA